MKPNRATPLCADGAAFSRSPERRFEQHRDRLFGEGSEVAMKGAMHQHEIFETRELYYKLCGAGKLREVPATPRVISYRKSDVPRW